MRSRIVFLLAAAVCAAGVSAAQNPPPGGGRMAVILIDIEALICPSCAAPLAEISRALAPPVLEERLRGIVVYRDPARQGADGRRGRIARLRWSGYARGNEVRFPVAFDDGHLFENAADGGFVVILADFASGSVRKIPGPIRSREIAEIAGFVCYNTPRRTS